MSRSVLVLAAFACSTSAPEPSPPPLLLSASPLVAGESAHITVDGANPGETVYLVFSRQGPGVGPCPTLLGGACFGLLAPELLRTITADTSGTATWEVVLPDPFPLEEVHLQAVTFGPTTLSAPMSWETYDHRVHLPLSPTWSDDFDRPDATELGSPPMGIGRWHEPNASGTTYASITGGEARLHYFVDTPTTPDQWMGLDALPVTDGVIEATLRSATNYPGLRLSYRLTNQDAGWQSAGYHLDIDSDTVTLFAGAWPVATAPFTDDHLAHTWRIRFEGDRHMVSVDGELVLDVNDATYTDGHIGLGAYFAIAYLDEISVQDLGTPAPIPWDSDESFDGPDSLVVDGWLESGDPTTSHIQVHNGLLDIHYFDDGTSIPVQSALAGVSVADFELRTQLRGVPNYMDASRPFGITYRNSPTGGRYSVQVTEDGVALYVGTTLVAEGALDIDTQWHALRVVVSGDRHQIWLDGHDLIDATDDTLMAAGDLGVFATYSIARYDTFQWRALQSPLVYPQHRPGELSAFPFGVYSVSSTRTAELAARGFNMIQSYGADESTLSRDAARYGMRTVSSLGTYYVDDASPPPNTTEAEAVAQIASVNAHASLGWWETPEEMRYWRANELTELDNVRAWNRLHDAHQAPLYSYNPAHRTAAAHAEIVPWLDIIAASGYRALTQQPAPWIRHQVQTVIEAIDLAGHTVGPDYLAGDKIPAITLATGVLGPATEVDAYHDVWASIAEGARGVMVFSYFWAIANEDHASMRGFARAASQLNVGPLAMGPVVLYGTPVEVPVTVLSGPGATEAFTPHNGTAQTLPSLVHQAWDFGGARTVLVVNSSDETVRARVEGLSGSVATVLFEGRELGVTGGSVEEDIEPLGVRLYRTTW